MDLDLKYFWHWCSTYWLKKVNVNRTKPNLNLIKLVKAMHCYRLSFHAFFEKIHRQNEKGYFHKLSIFIMSKEKLLLWKLQLLSQHTDLLHSSKDLRRYHRTMQEYNNLQITNGKCNIIVYMLDILLSETYVGILSKNGFPVLPRQTLAILQIPPVLYNF